MFADDIPPFLDVDVSNLQLNQGIKAKELHLPATVELLIDAESMIVNIVSVHVEETQLLVLPLQPLPVQNQKLLRRERPMKLLRKVLLPPRSPALQVLSQPRQQGENRRCSCEARSQEITTTRGRGDTWSGKRGICILASRVSSRL